MTLPLADLEAFVHDHRPHGGMTGDATDPAERLPAFTVASRVWGWCLSGG